LEANWSKISKFESSKNKPKKKSKERKNVIKGTKTEKRERLRFEGTKDRKMKAGKEERMNGRKYIYHHRLDCMFVD
jgi:hypothetical protein